MFGFCESLLVEYVAESFYLQVCFLFMLAGNITADLSFGGRQFYADKIEKENNFTIYMAIHVLWTIVFIWIFLNQNK